MNFNYEGDYKIEGEKYRGRFKGHVVRSKYKVRDEIKSNSWWEGVGVIIEKNADNRYIFEFTTFGTFYSIPNSLDKLILNFSDNSDKEVEDKDFPELRDYVLENMVKQVKNFNKEMIPSIILFPHKREDLVRKGFIPDEKGQMYFRF